VPSFVLARRRSPQPFLIERSQSAALAAIRVTVIASALVGFALPAAAADVVELRSGQRVEGTFKSADNGAVKIDVGGQIKTFDPEHVRAIYYGVPAGVSASMQTPGREAVRTLKTLLSVTTAGPTYTQYMGRLGHAKFRVDELWPKLTDAALRSAVSAAIRFFSAAADIWPAVTRAKASSQPGGQRVVDVRAAIAQSQEGCGALTRLQSASIDADAVIDSAVPAAWACASEQIGEAEKLAGTTQ
jgi:hypothetical protein